jgi:hypothetical protein
LHGIHIYGKYFSNSAYGTNGEGGNAGVKTIINGKEYLSTNGNVTGVMDFGKTMTYTSGVISNYTEISDTETKYTNGKSIIANVSDRKYVDLINTVSIKDMAITGWYSAMKSLGSSNRFPYSYRVGIFGFVGGAYSAGNIYGNEGIAHAKMTFRPVIWN